MLIAVRIVRLLLVKIVWILPLLLLATRLLLLLRTGRCQTATTVSTPAAWVTWIVGDGYAGSRWQADRRGLTESK